MIVLLSVCIALVAIPLWVADDPYPARGLKRALAGVVAVQVLELPWTPDPRMALVGAAAGALVALLAGLWATRKILDAPPSVTLREL